MSYSLLKRSLDLLESDYLGGTNEVKNKKLAVSNKHKNSNTSVNKRKRHSKDKTKFLWRTADNLGDNIIKNDKTSENINYLKLLSSGNVDEDTATKILKRSDKQLEDDVAKEENTVFTEEDFLNFEKEYFVPLK